MDNKIHTTHISLNTSEGVNSYNDYMDFIRSKYGDAYVDDGLPFVTPYEDTFEGWSSRQIKGQTKEHIEISHQIQEEEFTDWEEVKDETKLLGE